MCNHKGATAFPHGQGQQLANHPYSHRINQGGNYCGHDPHRPRLTLTSPIKHALDPQFKSLRANAWAHDGANTPKGGLPLIITGLIERLTQYYSRPRAVLPSLDKANNSDRQQRSERREACIVAMAAILKYTDVVSLRVGIPTAKGFVNLTFEQLLKHTHLGAKRFERAITDLKNAGLLTVAQPRELLSDGSWIGLAAVKAVNKKLFEAFGLAEKLKTERDKAAKRLKLQQEQWTKEQDGKPNRAGMARLSLFLTGEANKKRDKNTQPKPPSKSEQAEQQKEIDRRQKLVLNLQVRYRLENPDWTPAQCIQAAEKEADKQSSK